MHALMIWFQSAKLIFAFHWSMISSNLRVRERLLMFRSTISRGEYAISLSQCALLSLRRDLCYHLLLAVWSVSHPHLWLNTQKSVNIFLKNCWWSSLLTRNLLLQWLILQRVNFLSSVKLWWLKTKRNFCLLINIGLFGLFFVEIHWFKDVCKTVTCYQNCPFFITGSAQVEQGFSNNKSLIDENMSTDTIVALHSVYDYLKFHDLKAHEVELTKDVLASGRQARNKYFDNQ